MLDARLFGMPYFVCVFGDHLLGGHFDERSGDAVAAVVFARREHGNVATHGPAAVRFEFADDNAY
jgi:hypothetical protein